MHRFFLPDKRLRQGAVGDSMPLTENIARQLLNVLRVRDEEEIVLFAGDGYQWRAEVKMNHSVAKRYSNRFQEVNARLLERTMPNVALSVKVDLLMALTRPDRYEIALAKCTELGADRFVPVTSERVQRRDAVISENRLMRWNRIVAESAELAGRVTVPQLVDPVPLNKALRNLQSQNIQTIFLWERVPKPTLLQLMSHLHGKVSDASYALVIGPVGGFSDREARLAQTTGASLASLGKLVLRTDTAAIAAMTVAAQTCS